MRELFWLNDLGGKDRRGRFVLERAVETVGIQVLKDDHARGNGTDNGTRQNQDRTRHRVSPAAEIVQFWFWSQWCAVRPQPFRPDLCQPFAQPEADGPQYRREPIRPIPSIQMNVRSENRRSNVPCHPTPVGGNPSALICQRNVVVSTKARTIRKSGTAGTSGRGAPTGKAGADHDDQPREDGRPSGVRPRSWRVLLCLLDLRRVGCDGVVYRCLNRAGGTPRRCPRAEILPTGPPAVHAAWVE